MKKFCTTQAAVKLVATRFVACDDNGNVAATVSGSAGTTTSTYEYGPFGEVILSTGTISKTNLYRFSTKYQDNESDLLYYGCRYYNQSIGRWLSRDSNGKRGVLNLYGLVDNDPTDAFDPFGLDIYAPYRQMQFCQELKKVVDDSANEQVKDALAEYIKGRAKQLGYGPKDPWTLGLQNTHTWMAFGRKSGSNTKNVVKGRMVQHTAKIILISMLFQELKTPHFCSEI